MKRLLILFLTMLVAFSFSGCFDDDDDDAPAPTTGTITVKTIYNGTLTTETGDDNIGKIHVYLYKTLSANAQVTPDYSAKSDSIVADGTTQYTITVNNITPDSYYVVVFYDFKKHNQNVAGNTDRYVLYNANDTAKYTGNITSEATSVTVTAGSSDTLTFNFNADTYVLGSSGAFQTAAIAD